MTVLEFLVPPNDGPAVHSHLRVDEVWYVIEGDFRFKAGNAMLRASTGAWLSDRVGYRTPSRTSAMHPGGCW